MAPMKNDTMETSDLSQPHGLLVGWLDAPRPRKMVLPIQHHELARDWWFGVDRDSYRFACPGSKTTHCRHCYHIVQSKSREADKSSPHGSGPHSASSPEWRTWPCWPRGRMPGMECFSPCLNERGSRSSTASTRIQSQSPESGVQQSPTEGKRKK